MSSHGVWSSPPTGPSPSSVGIPFEEVQEPCLVDAAHRLEDLPGEAAGDRGNDGEHAVAVVAQAREAPADYLTDAFRNAQLGDVGDTARGPSPVLVAKQPAFLHQVAEHLADEEGIALRLTGEGGGQQAPPGLVLFVRVLLGDRSD